MLGRLQDRKKRVSMEHDSFFVIKPVIYFSIRVRTTTGVGSGEPFAQEFSQVAHIFTKQPKWN